MPELIASIHTHVLQPLGAAALRLQVLPGHTYDDELRGVRGLILSSITALTATLADAAPATTIEGPPATVDPSDLRAPRLCVIDDYPDNRVLVADLLMDAGYVVTSAGSASEFDLEQVGGDTPDIILMDIAMPGEDGISMTRRLRGNPRYADVTMVALTAYAMAGDAARGLTDGFDAYLTKPVDALTFAATIRSIMLSRPRSAVEGVEA